MSPLDDILKRLESIERRIARLEAGAGVGKPANLAAVATPIVPAPPASAKPQAERVRAVAEPAVGIGPGASPLPVVDPVTERLTPVSPTRPVIGDPPFPDLSQLDEKIEPRKGPAQKLDVRAALEDYPRISTRIQQLWGAPECEGYINNLVIDTRGNRKGFPPAMMEELLYLGRLARALVILNVGGDIWETLDQVGDRR